MQRSRSIHGKLENGDTILFNIARHYLGHASCSRLAPPSNRKSGILTRICALFHSYGFFGKTVISREDAMDRAQGKKLREIKKEATVKPCLTGNHAESYIRYLSVNYFLIMAEEEKLHEIAKYLKCHEVAENRK